MPDATPTMRLSPTESALLALRAPPKGSSPLVSAACAALPVEVLTTPFARSIFRLQRSADNNSLDFGIVFPQHGQYLEGDLLAVGVAALHAYAQINWTGPDLQLEVVSLFSYHSQVETTEKELNDVSIDLLALCGEPVYHLTKKAALLALALQIFGLIPSPFSWPPPIKGLSGPYGPTWSSLESLKIWRLRAGIMWIKVLDEPVPLPTYVAQDATSLRSSQFLDSSEKSQLSLSLSLLASLLSRSSPHSTAQKEASKLAREAADEEALEWELTGRLGKRTKWQVDEKTQLVVLARDRSDQRRRSVENLGMQSGLNGKVRDAGDKNALGEESTNVQRAKVPDIFDLNDDTLLERTSFSASAVTSSTDSSTAPLSSLDPSNQPIISPFSQSVLLALSLATLPQPTSLMHLSADVLSTSQVSAFVSRVLMDAQNWSVHSMALLLRCRAEAGRSRTVERGVLQMQALVDQLKDGNRQEVSAISSAVKTEDMAEARERLAQFHSLALPPAWELERELAVRYLSLGITKSALQIFTRLEMLEEVAKCWTSLERPDRGINIIKDLLEGNTTESDLVMQARKGSGARIFRGGEKREAKLWCILGELENNPAHYEKAWLVSNRSSSRAQRSLGATHWAAGRWAAASSALRLALAINPLFPRTWFVLGCCEMKLEHWAGAQEAFGRCVALEDDEAESWSNLASCHLRRGETEGEDLAVHDDDLDMSEVNLDPEAIATFEKPDSINDKDVDFKEARIKLPFSRKRAAFHCLKQAVKHSYDSWRMWYNYMIVAVDVGEMSEACRGLGRLVEMRASREGEAAVDLQVLERLVDAVTRDDQDSGDSQANEQTHVDPNVGRGLYPRVERLITTTILPSVSNSPRVFLAHARLLLWAKDYSGALDAHLKAYRAGVVNDATLEHDKERFIEAAAQVEEVIGVLENLGPKPKTVGDSEMVAKNWKFQAKSLLRTFLGRTKEAFEDNPEYQRLKELQQELQ